MLSSCLESTRRGLRGWLVFALLLFLGGVSAAQPPTGGKTAKPAWKWSVEERLARRFDPGAVKARGAEQAAERQAWSQRNGGSDPLFSIPPDTAHTMMIEGSKTPELFLTWELFHTLMTRAFSGDEESRRESRRKLEERAAALGFGKDLWARLEKAAAPFLKLQRQDEEQAHSPSPPSVKDGEDLVWCRTRAAAIAAAKAEFGEEAFLRLLYVGVAPSAVKAYRFDEKTAADLRFQEGGCR